LPAWAADQGTAEQGKELLGNIGRSLGLVDLHKGQS
jgi:hypothetical protein